MINAPMLKSILIGAALLTTASTVAAQAYPTRPVRFVVPYAPGGSTDTLARSIATVLADQLGQQVVVDNRTGANGDIGMTIVAKAPADGYTVVLGYIANIGIGPSLYEKMPYDPVKDFAPITQVAGASNIFVTHPSLPAKNFKEFIAYTKANPKKVSFATAGVASVGHLTGELLNDMAGIDMQHIPYKGSGQAISDLVGGHVKVMISGMASTLPDIHGDADAFVAVVFDGVYGLLAHRHRLSKSFRNIDFACRRFGLRCVLQYVTRQFAQPLGGITEFVACHEVFEMLIEGERYNHTRGYQRPNRSIAGIRWAQQIPG